ncbi:O-antigen ligase family protein [Aureispira]|nr:O-antigen ligase family protein [Aureispira sp.]
MISLLFLTIFLLQTRSTILGFIFATTGLFVFHLLRISKRKNRLLIIGASIIILIIGIALVSNTSFFAMHMNSESATERLLIWEKTFELANQNVFWGIGAGNWPIVFPSMGLPEISRALTGNIIFQKAHNEFLQTFSELGVIGLFSYMLFFLCFIKQSMNLLKQKPNLMNNILVLCAITYCFCMFFSFPNSRTEHLVTLGFLNGALANTNKLPNTSTFKLGKSTIVFILVLTVISLSISINRIIGEYNTKTMLFERERKNWENVIKLCKSSDNIFFKLDNTSTPIAWYSGMAYYHIGEDEKALNQFKRAYNLNPFNHHVLNNYALTVAKEDSNLAIQLLKNATRINPYFDSARSNLIKLLIKSRIFTDAETEINKIKDKHLQTNLFNTLEKFKTTIK